MNSRLTLIIVAVSFGLFFTITTLNAVSWQTNELVHNLGSTRPVVCYSSPTPKSGISKSTSKRCYPESGGPILYLPFLLQLPAVAIESLIVAIFGTFILTMRKLSIISSTFLTLSIFFGCIFSETYSSIFVLGTTISAKESLMNTQVTDLQYYIPQSLFLTNGLVMNASISLFLACLAIFVAKTYHIKQWR